MLNKIKSKKDVRKAKPEPIRLYSSPQQISASFNNTATKPSHNKSQTSVHTDAEDLQDKQVNIVSSRTVMGKSVPTLAAPRNKLTKQSHRQLAEQLARQESELQRLNLQTETLTAENTQLHVDLCGRISCTAYTYIELKDAIADLQAAFSGLKQVHAWKPSEEHFQGDADDKLLLLSQLVYSDSDILDFDANLPKLMICFRALVGELKAFSKCVLRRKSIFCFDTGDAFWHSAEPSKIIPWWRSWFRRENHHTEVLHIQPHTDILDDDTYDDTAYDDEEESALLLHTDTRIDSRRGKTTRKNDTRHTHPTARPRKLSSVPLRQSRSAPHCQSDGAPLRQSRSATSHAADHQHTGAPVPSKASTCSLNCTGAHMSSAPLSPSARSSRSTAATDPHVELWRELSRTRAERDELREQLDVNRSLVDMLVRMLETQKQEDIRLKERCRMAFIVLNA